MTKKTLIILAVAAAGIAPNLAFAEPVAASAPTSLRATEINPAPIQPRDIAPLTSYQGKTAPYAYAPRLTTTRRSSLLGWGGNGQYDGNGYRYSAFANKATAPTASANPTPIAGKSVQSKANTIETAAGDVSAPDSGLFGAEWSGRVNAGASLQTGNTESSTLTLDATLKAKWGDVHRASLKAEYNREEDDGDVTEDNRKLSAMYDYFFRPDWFVNSSLSLEQDDIDNIDLRSTLGVGLGHQAYESDALNLQYVLGPTYLRTEYEDGDTEDSLAARWALEYDQKFMDELFQGFHEHEILVPTDDTDAFLFDSKTGLRLPIRNGIVGTAQIDFEWDNDPEPGIKEDDTTYSLKLGYEW